MALEFGDGGAEALGSVAGGDLDEGDAAVEEDAGGVDVLLEVEFTGGGGVVGGASEPDDDDVVFDLGFEEEGRGDVSGGAEGDDVKGGGAGLEGPADEVARGGGESTALVADSRNLAEPRWVSLSGSRPRNLRIRFSSW